MKEDVLRLMIRKQIKSSLKEVDLGTSARSQVTSTLGRVEKMTGVKMLKKALGQGSAQQQAAGLLSVVNTISGDNPQVAKLLARMLMKNNPSDMGSVEEAKSAALKSRGDRVEKTQAMKLMKSAVSTKPATQQATFILDLIKSFNIKDAAKKRIFQNMRKTLDKKD